MVWPEETVSVELPVLATAKSVLANAVTQIVGIYRSQAGRKIVAGGGVGGRSIIAQETRIRARAGTLQRRGPRVRRDSGRGRAFLTEGSVVAGRIRVEDLIRRNRRQSIKSWVNVAEPVEALPFRYWFIIDTMPAKMGEEIDVPPKV